MPTLFDPIRIGDWNLSNRIIMAPLTRSRAEYDRVPNALMVEYYRQRASAGLIISEATAITPKSVGYLHTPGIWSAEQIKGWQAVTRAVHELGSKIVMQLWHVGRVSDPSLLDGDLPVAPSPIAPSGHVSLLRPMRPYVVPRELRTEEIPGIVEAYRVAAQHAQQAGFDGVEIHGANGYLPDQFLEDGTNHRTDQYGGSIENRARFMLEITDAVISVWGASRVGMHLSPNGVAHDMHDSDPAATFGYVARELGKRKLAFIFGREPLRPGWLTPQLKKTFGGVYIANEGFTLATANEVLATGQADAVAFGVSFIANPDLPERFRRHAELNPPDEKTFFATGPAGYTDYPALAKR